MEPTQIDLYAATLDQSPAADPHSSTVSQTLLLSPRSHSNVFPSCSSCSSHVSRVDVPIQSINGQDNQLIAVGPSSLTFCEEIKMISSSSFQLYRTVIAFDCLVGFQTLTDEVRIPKLCVIETGNPTLKSCPRVDGRGSLLRSLQMRTLLTSNLVRRLERRRRRSGAPTMLRRSNTSFSVLDSRSQAKIAGLSPRGPSSQSRMAKRDDTHHLCDVRR